MSLSQCKQLAKLALALFLYDILNFLAILILACDSYKDNTYEKCYNC